MGWGGEWVGGMGRNKKVQSFLKLRHHSVTPRYRFQSQTHPTRTDSWVFIPKMWTVRTLRRNREPQAECPFFVVLWIKDQPGRQGARAASFPSWGSARRHVRVRVSVRKELSLGVGNSPRNSTLANAKSTQPSKTRNWRLQPLHFLTGHMPTSPEPAAQFICRLRCLLQASSCPPSYQSRAHTWDLARHPYPHRCLLGGLSPRIFPVCFSSSTYIALFTFSVHSPGTATSLRKEPLLKHLLS